MLYAVHALDAPSIDRRPYEAQHKAHLTRASEFGVKLVIGGPLVRDDSTASIGSLMIFEAQAKEQVQAYNDADPYRVEGVWHTVHIARFDRKT